MRTAVIVAHVWGTLVRGSKEPAPAVPTQTYFPFGLPHASQAGVARDTHAAVAEGVTIARDARNARADLRSLKTRREQLDREGAGIEASYQAMNQTLDFVVEPKVLAVQRRAHAAETALDAALAARGRAVVNAQTAAEAIAVAKKQVAEGEARTRAAEAAMLKAKAEEAAATAMIAEGTHQIQTLEVAQDHLQALVAASNSSAELARAKAAQAEQAAQRVEAIASVERKAVDDSRFLSKSRLDMRKEKALRETEQRQSDLRALREEQARVAAEARKRAAEDGMLRDARREREAGMAKRRIEQRREASTTAGEAAEKQYGWGGGGDWAWNPIEDEEPVDEAALGTPAERSQAAAPPTLEDRTADAVARARVWDPHDVSADPAPAAPAAPAAPDMQAAASQPAVAQADAEAADYAAPVDAQDAVAADRLTRGALAHGRGFAAETTAKLGSGFRRKAPAKLADTKEADASGADEADTEAEEEDTEADDSASDDTETDDSASDAESEESDDAASEDSEASEEESDDTEEADESEDSDSDESDSSEESENSAESEDSDESDDSDASEDSEDASLNGSKVA